MNCSENIFTRNDSARAYNEHEHCRTQMNRKMKNHFRNYIQTL